jgi:hypothetical protein
MKNVKILARFFGLLMIMAGISCASAPPPEEEAPAPVAVQPAQPVQDPNLGPPDQAALASLAAAKARVEDARKRAFDFGGPEYAEGDWEAAEALYAAAGEQEKSDTLGNTRESAARYEQAAAAFDDAFNQALPKYAQTLEDEILRARAAALDAGIATLSPEHLQNADDTVDKALGLYEAEDYYSAADTGRLALDMFRLLKIGADAYAVRAAALDAGIVTLSPERLQNADDTADKALGQYEAEDYYSAADTGRLALDMFRLLKIGADTYAVWREIEDYGFGKYDPDTYDAANTTALAAVDGYDALSYEDGDDIDIKAVLVQAEEAQIGYTKVLGTGWKAYASERQASAGAERQVALDLKANVAVRDEYGSAQALYDRAGVSFRQARYPEAAEFYFQAEFLFASAAGTAAEKRRIAEEAILEAEAKAAASDETARKAEAVLEGENE